MLSSQIFSKELSSFLVNEFPFDTLTQTNSSTILAFLSDVANLYNPYSGNDYNKREAYIDSLVTPLSSKLESLFPNQPIHHDFPDIGEAGDILVKDGYYYASTYENGTHFVAIAQKGSSLYFVNNFGEISYLLEPEEFRIVGNISKLEQFTPNPTEGFIIDEPILFVLNHYLEFGNQELSLFFSKASFEFIRESISKFNKNKFLALGYRYKKLFAQLFDSPVEKVNFDKSSKPLSVNDVVFIKESSHNELKGQFKTIVSVSDSQIIVISDNGVLLDISNDDFVFYNTAEALYEEFVLASKKESQNSTIKVWRSKGLSFESLAVYDRHIDDPVFLAKLFTEDHAEFYKIGLENAKRIASTPDSELSFLDRMGKPFFVNYLTKKATD